MGRPPDLFAELSRWRHKATQRGKVVDFNSDILPDWLHDEVLAAQEAVGPEVAFSFMKQTPLDVRMAAERRIKRKIQAILKERQAQAARAIERGEEFDYEGMAEELRAAVLPELSHLVVDNALRLSVEVGIGFDPAIINTEALRWAREYSYKLVTGLTPKTRKVLVEAMDSFINTPGMTIGDIESLIEPAFGAVRAEMIAVTETTRAYSMATNEMYDLLQREAPTLRVTKVWTTMNDELVCFPAWTLVDTATGRRPIQYIRSGDLVRTREGYRPVAATNKRAYNGAMVRVETNQQSVVATANHPFWTLEQGWLQGRDLKAHQTLQLIDDQVAEIRRVVDFAFEGTVYNLQVEGVPEFYANGVLVHNCEICGPLEGAPQDVWLGRYPKGPPAHVRCILPGNVVSVPGLVGGAQSFYVGRAVEISTSGGRILTVTENHPILTRKGWVAADLLSEGDDVIVCTAPEWIASSVYPDNQHMPAAIEKVFGSLEMSEAMFRSRVPATAEDFHGDGRGMYGYINVVGPNRFLLGDIETRLTELFSKSTFNGNSTDETLFVSEGTLAFLSPGDISTTGGGMSSRDLIEAALWRHPGPFYKFGRRTPTGLDVAFKQNALDSTTIDTKLAAEFVRRFASLIATDKVGLIRKFDFSGHVYDLQSGIYGLYTCNGVLVKNCRCEERIVFLTEEQLAAEFAERQAQREAWMRERGLIQ